MGLLTNIFSGQYEVPASRYHADVAARKGAALKEKMLDSVYALYLKQIRKVYEAAASHADELAKQLSPPTRSKESKTKQVGSHTIKKTKAHV